jgi:hypothetical protein
MSKQSFFIMVLLTLLSLSVFAQMPISITGSMGGGLLSPQSSNIKGDIYSVYDYPLSKSSYLLGGKLRVGLMALPISFTGNLSYNYLSDNATIPVTTNGGVVNSIFTSSLSILTVGIGAEYTLFPTPIVKPYASGNLSMNLISGSAKYDNDIIPESKLNSTDRIGIAVGIGTLIEVPVFPISFDVEAKYNFANVIGKTFDSKGYSYSGFGGIPQTATYNLNDAKNPTDSKDHDRSINYLTLLVSINFKIL